MGLTIKDEEAQRLAEQLAALTGESMSTVVTQALRERLDRLRSEQSTGLADRLLDIGRECAPRLKEPYRSADHGDLLYDDKGLPR
ncbi:type II toxin-antitoxin system VapB family antitoxin [Roseomonas genomospecies 6]|uniref:Transcription factor n=1 Tax=Roseomonas genomospecies 6 TaxID=214106 RepID=A0A9W7NK71_9PROT|nr:type II toxin-antitoxin system VapB family antitoxin [Roseomonas genomospecies 6]KAA0681075.1 transcription factor [Roseomonas genomospecies 6]